MSRENVEIVRRAFDAYARAAEEHAADLLDADVVWNPIEEMAMHGQDAVLAYLERWESAWERLETIPEEFIDAGDRVIVSVHFRGRGQGSGIEVDARVFEVYTLRDSKIVRMDEFTERSEALQAAELQE